MHGRISLLSFLTMAAAIAPFGAPPRCTAQMVELFPTDDGFVRQAAPTLCYGSAGALCVAGSGQPGGRFDTAIKFDTSTVAQQFDVTFGAGAWTVTSVQLQLVEVGDPQNPIFSQGIGQFEVRWLSNDNWVEGTGFPFGPTVGVGNQMTWNLLQTLLASGTEASLGTFANTNPTMNALHLYTLALDPLLVADIRLCGVVSFQLLPATTTIGFVFNSGDYLGTTTTHPRLLLTVQAAAAVLGDVDGDFDVDLLDHAAFASALTGPEGPPSGPCERADINEDGHVDLADAALLQNAFIEG